MSGWDSMALIGVAAAGLALALLLVGLVVRLAGASVEEDDGDCWACWPCEGWPGELSRRTRILIETADKTTNVRARGLDGLTIAAKVSVELSVIYPQGELPLVGQAIDAADLRSRMKGLAGLTVKVESDRLARELTARVADQLDCEAFFRGEEQGEGPHDAA